MAGQFEVYKDDNGQYCFRMKASNGQVILNSKPCEDKAACMNNIHSVKMNANSAHVIDMED